MNSASIHRAGFHLPVLQGVLPVNASQIPVELIAGLYTILIPMALFALFDSSRHSW